MELITSRKNKTLAHFRRLCSDRAYRYERGEYVCDGAKLLAEALRYGARVRTVLKADGEGLPELPESTERYRVPDDLLRYVSPLENSPGPVFSVTMPEWDVPAELSAAIVLEDIQDPGNVGTILRTANAFSMGAVILTGACADPYGPKAVRAAMGAVFRQRVVQIELGDLKDFTRARGLRLIGAASRGDAVDVCTLSDGGAAVAIGNEGRGLSDTLLAMCGAVVKIPINPDCESLNAAVAAAIVMYQLTGGDGICQR